VRALAEEVSARARRRPPPSVEAARREVHAGNLVGARRWGNSLFMLHETKGQLNLSRWTAGSGRPVSMPVRGVRPDALAVGAGGVALVAGREALLLDHGFRFRGAVGPILFCRVGGGVAWVGYLVDGADAVGLMPRRAAHELRVRTVALEGEERGLPIVADVSLGEVRLDRPPFERRRTRPPQWNCSIGAEERPRTLSVQIGRGSEQLVAVVDDSGAVTPGDGRAAAPWLLASVDHEGHRYSLLGSDYASEEEAEPNGGTGPASFLVDGGMVKHVEDPQAEARLQPTRHGVFGLVLHRGAAGDRWWELYRLAPDGATRVYRAETAQAAFAADEGSVSWFVENRMAEEGRCVGVFALRDGRVGTTNLEQGLAIEPLGLLGGRLFAVASEPGGGSAVVSYPWHS
jgi:hypothetical protein